ncbi:MAG: GntR family transcriptional regulator [Bacteroides sp.]|nr:GntR family transcriptional regulator [Bacteroides sp.]
MVFKENNKAIYLQIADKISDDVLTGLLQVGARIPSVREYAATLEVNANTVMRSYEHLERLGVIFNRRGIGFFIADNAREVIINGRRETFLNGEVQYFFHQLMLLDITPEEAKTMYENYLKEKSK